MNGQTIEDILVAQVLLLAKQIEAEHKANRVMGTPDVDAVNLIKSQRSRILELLRSK